MTDKQAREIAMVAFWNEVDRQCSIGAGEAFTCPETGLFIINANIDPTGMANAMIRALTPTPPNPRLEEDRA